MSVAATLLAVLLALAPAAASAARPAMLGGAAPLVLVRTIPLRGVRGRIDHLAIDLAHGRLFVSELGNGSVEAIDLATGASLGRIGGLKEPQGLAFLPALHELAVASGGDGSVRFYRAGDLAPAGEVAVGGDADDLTTDAAGRLVVGYGSGAIAAIDPVSRKVVGKLDLPAHPEGFRLAGARVFVNLPGADRIVVGDLPRGRILASWPTAHRWNFPMALGAAAGTLAVAFRRPARFELLDAASGAIKLDEPTCGDADDLFFDRARDRFYVVCGAGAVDVVDPMRPARSVAVATRPGARTGLFVPALDRLFVAARAGARGAAILVYRPRARLR
ncbi:MAG TPA: hypothetical protein VMU93_03230 [Caulobacteraceae bacterium]|nr:hypothetical protein [Caulobacteraceae bacterium]